MRRCERAKEVQSAAVRLRQDDVFAVNVDAPSYPLFTNPVHAADPLSHLMLGLENYTHPLRHTPAQTRMIIPWGDAILIVRVLWYLGFLGC